MLLQKASELAVSGIVPFVGQRSVFKSSDQFRNLRVKWQKICDEATEQAQNLHRCLVQMNYYALSYCIQTKFQH